ncbi:hypothetical protein EOS_22335 [Caballeronia mineralivorans PML1(12)]|uniref:Uncharacterized protein n=1 Tax=Caballeronia mineralivorans PML1(12) TaxID=908627 RepID=A0A0J1CTU4_9BURK|nr:hypothetical protein EOS_22335 [Caballeronia mineralivorans PML1(12)]
MIEHETLTLVKLGWPKLGALNRECISSRGRQQNAALVEQVSAASRALAEQAKAFRKTVAVLRLHDDYTVTVSGSTV